MDCCLGCFACNLGTGRGTSVLEMVTAFEKASGKVVLVFIYKYICTWLGKGILICTIIIMKWHTLAADIFRKSPLNCVQEGLEMLQKFMPLRIKLQKSLIGSNVFSLNCANVFLVKGNAGWIMLYILLWFAGQNMGLRRCAGINGIGQDRTHGDTRSRPPKKEADGWCLRVVGNYLIMRYINGQSRQSEDGLIATIVLWIRWLVSTFKQIKSHDASHILYQKQLYGFKFYVLISCGGVINLG